LLFVCFPMDRRCRHFLFFIRYFHLVLCYISDHRCQQEFCFCWPVPSVEFDRILFDQCHFFHQFYLSSLDSHMKIRIYIYKIIYHRHFLYDDVILL
jgi:hypothetical protein